jgi:hypothetical protein
MYHDKFYNSQENLNILSRTYGDVHENFPSISTGRRDGVMLSTGVGVRRRGRTLLVSTLFDCIQDDISCFCDKPFNFFGLEWIKLKY